MVNVPVHALLFLMKLIKRNQINKFLLSFRISLGRSQPSYITQICC